MNLDAYCREILQRAPQTVIPWFLMASWLYYHRHVAILSDGFYDWLAQTIAANWEFFTHRHKSLITRADLVAGSLYRLTADDYPAICRDTAEGLYQRMTR